MPEKKDITRLVSRYFGRKSDSNLNDVQRQIVETDFGAYDRQELKIVSWVRKVLRTLVKKMKRTSSPMDKNQAEQDSTPKNT